MIEERLLGFDAREERFPPEGLWDGARRDTFLLRVDVEIPRSVDVLVWPSLFDTGQGIGFPPEVRQRLGLAGIARPPWTGPNAGLWDRLDEMVRYLEKHWTQPLPYSLVAISWLSGSGFLEAGNVGPYLGPTEPAGRAEGWRLLGYDVADGSLLSGLSNCGYLPSEVDEYRERWSPLLNENHLFEDPGDAFRFRDLTDARVQSHAPFFVYGLFVVR